MPFTNLFAQEEATEKKLQLDIVGALRFNYNNSSWKPNQQKRGGDFGFETLPNCTNPLLN